MFKKLTIHFLTHAYPVWVVLHLVYGNWSTRSQLAFNTMPLIIFGGLLKVATKKLSYRERRSIDYLVFMLFVITGYYNICVLSSSKWVYDHNNQMAGFIILTFIFYLYCYYEPR